MTGPDLGDPFWTVKHLARALFISVDRARDYAAREDFPASVDLGARLMWAREEVLAWFAALPRRARAARGQCASVQRAHGPATTPGRAALPPASDISSAEPAKGAPVDTDDSARTPGGAASGPADPPTRLSVAATHLSEAARRPRPPQYRRRTSSARGRVNL